MIKCPSTLQCYLINLLRVLIALDAKVEWQKYGEYLRNARLAKNEFKRIFVSVRYFYYISDNY